jgi:hypothetical protein
MFADQMDIARQQKKTEIVDFLIRLISPSQLTLNS